MSDPFNGPQLCDAPGCLGIARQSLAIAGGAFVCDEHCEAVNNTLAQTHPVTHGQLDLSLALIAISDTRTSLNQ